MAMKCSFCAMPEEKKTETKTETKTMKYVAVDTRLDNIQRAEVEPTAEPEAEALLGDHLAGTHG